MMKYFWAAVGALCAVTNLPLIFTSQSTIGSLFSAFFFAVGVYLVVKYGPKVVQALKSAKAEASAENAAYYDRGYSAPAGEKPPVPTTGSAVKPPMSQGWQVPQPSSALPHSTTPVAPHSVSSDNNPTLNMGIGALVGGVLGWQLGKSSEPEETKEAPAPRAYRLGDAGDVGATGAVGDVGEPSYALPAITSEELDRSSPAPSYESPSYSSYDSGSSSSSDSSGGGE